MNMNTVSAPNTEAIIRAEHISQSFTAENGSTQHVLKDISFTLHEGEIVAILGRSGAGKSTFLRTLAGLVEPTAGSVAYRGKTLTGPNPGVAIIFQNFALMPWLTVQNNVELGLRARGVKRKERIERALAAIDSIGLDGFESAYPKELSGGMRQRVGIARALVLRPDALFMDEPFSALDVLTAENLRQEVLKLWSKKERDIKSVLIVTHNIEEAVQMADRVIVLGSHPGHLIADLRIDLPRPRNRHSAEFGQAVDRLYAILTGATSADTTNTPGTGHRTQREPGAHAAAQSRETAAITEMLMRRAGNSNPAHSSGNTPIHMLPNATPGGLAGLLDVMADTPAGLDLADIAADLSFEIDDLFPLVDAGILLNVLTAENGHVTITAEGKKWHRADILTSKQIFARLALNHAPLVCAIDRALANNGGKLRGELILDLLRSRHPNGLAKQQFETAISWGRYGELFDYDADDDELTRTVGQRE